MNKKVLIALGSLLLGINLFAYEKTLQPKVLTNFGLFGAKDDSMEVLVDCTYKKSGLGLVKTYTEDKMTQEFLTMICTGHENTQNVVIPFGDFKNAISKGKHDNASLNLSNNYDDLLNKTRALELELNFINNHWFSPNEYNRKTFKIVSLNNLHMEYKFIYGRDEITDETYNTLITDYKYDFINNKIDSFEFSENLNTNLKKVLINTYDIDNISECINGDIWIKKYSAVSNRKCDWIEKK